MTITMQGGLHVTLAYSHEPGNYFEAPIGDNCNNLQQVNELNNMFGDDAERPSFPPVNQASVLHTTWNAVIEMLAKSDLYKRAEREMLAEMVRKYARQAFSVGALLPRELMAGGFMAVPQPCLWVRLSSRACLVACEWSMLRRPVAWSTALLSLHGQGAWSPSMTTLTSREVR
jgi:hypothetical protein